MEPAKTSLMPAAREDTRRAVGGRASAVPLPAGLRAALGRWVSGQAALLVATLGSNTLWGMSRVEGFLWAPLGFLVLAGSFRAMDPALEESAMASGAGIWHTATRVPLPLSAPASLSVALLVYIRAFESF